MAHYHVLLTLNEGPTKERCAFGDLSEGELKNRFLRPYAKGSHLLCAESEIIALATIRRVRIIRTDLPSALVLRKIQEESRKTIDEINSSQSGALFLSVGWGYDPEDIAHAGTDVTNTYVTGPPGERSTMGVLTNHPWISGIGTAVIAAGVAKFFGWV